MCWLRRYSDDFRLQTKRWLAPLLLLCAVILPTSALAVVNSATGNYSGTALDLTAATVTLNRVTGDAITSALGEINPGSLTIAPAQTIDLTVTPEINPGDSGLNWLEVIIPAGFSNITLPSISLNGFPVAQGSCPTPAAGTVCSSLTGNTLTVLFGTPVTSNNTRIGLRFSADTPLVPGINTFTVTVDDTTTPAVSQIVTAGDADGITTNNNSLDVTVSTGIDPNRSTFVATPTTVLADNTTTSTLTVTLVDAAGIPVAGHAVSLSSDRGGLDTMTVPAPTDVNGQTTATIRSGSVGVSIVTATDSNTGTILNQRAERDGLTNLYNRRAFDQYMELVWRQS